MIMPETTRERFIPSGFVLALVLRLLTSSLVIVIPLFVTGALEVGAAQVGLHLVINKFLRAEVCGPGNSNERELRVSGSVGGCGTRHPGSRGSYYPTYRLCRPLLGHDSLRLSRLTPSCGPVF